MRINEWDVLLRAGMISTVFGVAEIVVPAAAAEALQITLNVKAPWSCWIVRGITGPVVKPTSCEQLNRTMTVFRLLSGLPGSSSWAVPPRIALLVPPTG